MSDGPDPATSSQRGAAPTTAATDRRARRRVGRIEWRATLAVAFMAALPLVIGVTLATGLARRAVDEFYDPRVGDELETSLGLYKPLVRAIKADMKHRAAAIAASEPLRAAAAIHDEAEVDEELKAAFAEYSDTPAPSASSSSSSSAPGSATDDAPLVALVALEVWADLDLDDCLAHFLSAPLRVDAPAASAKASASAASPAPSTSASDDVSPLPTTARRLARVDRGRSIDAQREYSLVQCKPLGSEDATGKAPPSMLVATFATDRRRVDHVQDAATFVSLYREVEHRRAEWVRLNVSFYVALLATTVLIASVLGFLLARSITSRVTRVRDAAQRVAGGDLDVRVPAEGDDEIFELAIAFNRMVGEIAHSRARIEYLQRVGAWQDMARRLAHEIKNPLTPIQLAIEEAHHKIIARDDEEIRAGNPGDPRIRKLLDTTLEIVREEVGTLRRLVTEFSEFARLPRARLEPAELSALLADVRPLLERLGLATEAADVAGMDIRDVLRLTPSGGTAIPVRVRVQTAVKNAPEGHVVRVAVDRQMMRKTLDNLVRNAVQAIRGAGRGLRVEVGAELLPDGRIAIDIDDDGPGVPEESRARIFDPYFTTRTEGTGLGLAIVKKIVLEHGGTIACDVSPYGGARLRIVLPSADSAEGLVALEEARAVDRTPEEIGGDV